MWCWRWNLWCCNLIWCVRHFGSWWSESRWRGCWLHCCWIFRPRCQWRDRGLRRSTSVISVSTVRDEDVFEAEIRDHVFGAWVLQTYVLDCDVISARDSHTVILIKYRPASDEEVRWGGDVVAIWIMGSRETAADCVWSVASCVVEDDIFHEYICTIRDWETVHRIVLDVQVLDHRVCSDFVHHDHMVGPIRVSLARLEFLRWKIYLFSPPLLPWPSQYAWPLPSMTWPGAPWIVIPAPPITIGLNFDELV